MLKKIPVRQLRLGMHLVRLEASWTSHPFWRTQFRIERPDDLAALQACGVQECWIDPALGIDAEADPEAEVPPAAPAPAVVAPASPAAEPAMPAQPRRARAPASPADLEHRSMQAEIGQAARICQQARGAVVSMFGQVRLGQAIDPASVLPVVEAVTASVARNARALVSLARMKTRDDYGYMHSVAVCGLMVALARQLGMDEDRCREAGLGGLLHDIGKAAIPVSLLDKPGRLTAEEFAIVRTHPERGVQLLDGDKSVVSEEVRAVVLLHHERFDGTGYPHRLGGERIPLLARMGAVCDVYDAISSNRPYKHAWDPAESLSRMATWQGQFDPSLLAALVQTLGIYPVGSVVELDSGRLAIVVAQNPQRLLAPRVRAFHSLRDGRAIEPPQTVDLSSPRNQDRIVRRAPPGAGEHPRRDRLWADADSLRRMHEPATA